MASRPIGQPLTRREFSAASISALFVGMTVWMSGCGGGGSSASPASPTSTSSPSPTGVGDKSGSISANHGHVATVTGAQLQAGGGVTLHIQGTSSHDHTLDLTSGEIGQIASGGRMSKNSSSDAGHNHTVTFN
jgi:hypothetical protein